MRRDGIARQMRGRLQTAQGNDLNVEAPEEYHELTSCIECYACLNNCPMHRRNFNGGLPARWTRPIGRTRRKAIVGAILLVAEAANDPPGSTDHRGRPRGGAGNAIDLGLDECVGCPGCKCGVGINLKGLVVKALVDVAGDRLPSAAERARTRA